MNKITTMDRKNAGNIRKILETELEPILKQHGLSFDLGNASYDDDSVKFNGFRISIEGGLSVQEKALEREIADRRNYEFMVELDPTKVTKSFGMKVSLVGFKPRARKRPFVIRDLETAKEYIISTEQAEKLFGPTISSENIIKVSL
tara:strand:+ start:318 stop:755 length:438 start_codon:yes stop_codon:yes gene_type:complete